MSSVTCFDEDEQFVIVETFVRDIEFWYAIIFEEETVFESYGENIVEDMGFSGDCDNFVVP